MSTPNRRMAQYRPEGSWTIRVYHRRAHEKRSPRYLLKCGCCDESVEIHYGDASLEINGVHGSLENWREILMPLLFPESQGREAPPTGQPRE